MELLSPAGNLEKLEYVYRYGADAAYIGIGNFSLRAKADSLLQDSPQDSLQNEHRIICENIRKIKGDKKLYGALNIFFHNPDLRRLEENLDYLSLYPLDAFIISDIGILPLLKKRFPGAEFHLSTQANCTNSEAARMYRDMGFSRIILGREVSLSEIEEIRRSVENLELEAFVHGAMCLAYSGRCFLSAWMTGRSGNKGACAHSCRWEYRVLEEKERPGEYYPIIEGENFTSILSSKDLCMIDYLAELKDAGIDSIKIEGRMKSVYYAAIVTRAYRKSLDALEGKEVPDLPGFREDLSRVSHREYSTGFFFSKDDIQHPTLSSYKRNHVFLGSIGEEISSGVYSLNVKNQIRKGEEVEYIGPDLLSAADKYFTLFNEEGNEIEKADHGKPTSIRPGIPAEPGFLLRKAIGEGYWGRL
ncbi:MAG: U32 family peptidase C-terminal domain-containing protein [Spirochaetales bacterium]|nr:U32 family peptidase C-terminal domain-containing protein [Spirochaetales bacterium]